jgi:hypothetical protein
MALSWYYTTLSQYSMALSPNSIALSVDSSNPSRDSIGLSKYFPDFLETLRGLCRLWKFSRDFRDLTTIFRAFQKP